MEKFYLEKPTIIRKQQAIEYLEEHLEYDSKMHGMGGLDTYYKNYEYWLERLKITENSKTCPEDKCPGYTYFLIREKDDKIIGMICIRYNLNEKMLIRGGHIGFGIRPTERKKGYNKINLYLGLKKCKELGLSKVLLTASDDNMGSFKTILALGGVLENKIIDEQNPDIMIGRYYINVIESLKNAENEYSKYEI